MPRTKKEVKKLEYEDYNILKANATKEAASHIVSAFGPEWLVKKVHGKSMVKNIEASISVVRITAHRNNKEYLVKACLETFSWNDRMHGGVISFSVVVDGDEADSNIAFDCLYPHDTGSMVFEVLEDITSTLANCAYEKACDIERKK